MAVSKIHYCKSQEYVAQRIDDPPAAKCRCKKYIGSDKAKKMVDEGAAKFIVLSRSQAPVDVPCPLCQADSEVKNCANCRGTGKVSINNISEVVGDDIVLVSRHAIDKKERKYRPALAMKTPRVATIESEHIELAYVDNVKEAQERIEEYGRLILDARMFVGKDRIPCIVAEPKDDKKAFTGPTYDYGRAI